MDGNMIVKCRSYLIEKLFKTAPFYTFDEEKAALFDTITKTIERGECEDILVVDTTCSLINSMVNRVLEKIRSLEEYDGNYEIIQLDGIFLNDDNEAFKIIAECLSIDCTDMEVSGSFAEKVTFAVQSLLTAGETTKSLIFIINQFERFCLHENQTLIYNLFDIVYYKKAPICVVGVTNDHECIKKFGKRTLSRFSNKIINLRPSNVFETNKHALKSLLSISGTQFNQIFKNEWNKNIEDLCSSQPVIDIIKKISKKPIYEETLRDIVHIILCNIEEESPHITSRTIEDVVKQFHHLTIEDLLADLSLTHLCLIVAIYHHTMIYNSNRFNFKMIYDRYSKASRKFRTLPQMGLEKAEKSFEYLKKDFLSPVQFEHTFLKEYDLYCLTVDVREVKSYINSEIEIPDEIKMWINDSLIAE